MRWHWISLVLLASLTICAEKGWTVYSIADRPSALALIDDRYHSPVYVRENLVRALVGENVPTTFIEDVTALNAESLGKHDLLIILRDGMNWPAGYDKPHAK